MKFLAILAAAGVAVMLAGPGQAQTVDKNGRCHDASGKFAKMEVCEAAKPASCRDKTTKKFAKCDAPNTEPVPRSSSK
jgi:hypothetical protein